MGLEQNNFVYETLLRQVRRLRRAESRHLLPFIETVANEAFRFHPGRFADGALENPLLEARLEPSDAEPVKPMGGALRRSSPSRTLHVASSVHITGGHSRVLTKWMQRDMISSPALVLTRQTDPVPDFLAKIWADRGTAVTLLNPQDSIVNRGRQLKSLSAGFDRVILHHHPDDAVPVIAFAKAGGCPVAMFNHAHFWFSLGSTVSDVTINTTRYFQGLTRTGRFPKDQALLAGSGGLEPLRWSEIEKRDAKAALGLPADRPVALSIGQEPYYLPIEGYDFFKTAGKLLEMLPELYLVVVGVREASQVVPDALRKNGRLLLTGPVADAKPYYQAADVCLESFPWPSLGALIESVAYGEAFPVQAYGVGEHVLRRTHDLLATHAERAKDEEEYLSYIRSLINSGASTRERAAVLRKMLIARDEAFGEQFTSLYRQIDAATHEPSTIPETQCCREYDHQLLASPLAINVGREIETLLPMGPAFSAHIRATFGGYESIRQCCGWLKRRALE